MSGSDKTGACDGEALARRIVTNAMASGIGPDDVLWPFVSSVCLAVARMSDAADRVEAAGDRVIGEIRQAPASLTARARTAQIAPTERGARTSAVRWTAIAAGAAFAGCAIFFAGRASTASIGPPAASRQDVAGVGSPRADAWDLIRSWNDLGVMMKGCTPQVDPSLRGRPRRYCVLPVWIDPPG